MPFGRLGLVARMVGDGETARGGIGQGLEIDPLAPKRSFQRASPSPTVVRMAQMKDRVDAAG